jgi:hypothetical protein
MAYPADRVTIHHIPPPATDKTPTVPGVVPRVHWLSAVLFLVGFAVYFGTLMYSNSAAGIAAAICLFVLGIVVYVASALHQQVDTISPQWLPTDMTDAGLATHRDEPAARPMPDTETQDQATPHHAPVSS